MNRRMFVAGAVRAGALLFAAAAAPAALLATSSRDNASSPAPPPLWDLAAVQEDTPRGWLVAFACAFGPWRTRSPRAQLGGIFSPKTWGDVERLCAAYHSDPRVQVELYGWRKEDPLPRPTPGEYRAYLRQLRRNGLRQSRRLA